MKEGLIFANARAKSKESNLFTEERLRRMMETKTLHDAIRILLEVNYAGGLVPEDADFYSLLNEEERLATMFVREAAPENVGFECFFLRNDYHNIKVLFKGKYAQVSDLSEMILPDGNYRFAELKERFEQEKLDFSPHVEHACRTIRKGFETGLGTPRLIDIELDCAMYRDINDRLKAGVDRNIKDYFVAQIDLINIASFVRTVRIGGQFSFFEECFLEGGSLDIQGFRECGTDDAKLSKFLSGTNYKPFYEKIEGSDLVRYETAQDDYLLKIFSVNKTDMFSVAPILGYYLAKLNEIKVLRVVLVCIKNRVSTEEMRKRVRVLYA